MNNNDNAAVAIVTKTGEIIDIASNSAVEMQRNLAEMKAKLGMIQQYIREVMVEGMDYGVIPGTEKQTLFQPGADKLCSLYGFARHIVGKEENKDLKTGHYDVTVKVQIRHIQSSMVVGEGEGSCSTYESKYRYRWAYDSQIPKGIDKSTLFSQTFKSRKPGENKEYTRYRLDNQDLFDVWNTVLKMAIKRAYVSATLASTGLSGVFNQEEEDFEAWLAENEGDGKSEKLEKVKAAPKAGDEKADFNPGAVEGATAGGPAPDPNGITQSQYGKIIGDAKRKGLDEVSIKALVLYTKKKPLDKLTKAEASGVIEFMTKTEQAELQAWAAKAQSAAPTFSPEELGDK